MKHTIWKSFNFDAAHRLPHVEAGHPCGNTHGHTYKLELELCADRLEDGMVVDYAVLTKVVEPVIKRKKETTKHKNRADCVDHTTLNQVKGLENPTTEVLAEWFFNKFRAHIPFLVAITVWESSTTRAEYRP